MVVQVNFSAAPLCNGLSPRKAIAEPGAADKREERTGRNRGTGVREHPG